MVESYWVKPASVPLINRSVGWFSPTLPPPFQVQICFQEIAAERDTVGEHLIDISRPGMYYTLYLVNPQIFRGDYICGLLVHLLIVFLSFFRMPVSLPFSISTAKIKSVKRMQLLENITLVKLEWLRQKKNGKTEGSTFKT